MRPRPAERILDIGCGVGASLRYIPDGVEYVGIDIEPRYIEAARRTYGSRGTFICGDLAAADLGRWAPFDRAFSVGVLHHLSDASVAGLVKLLRASVRPGRPFASIDPCWHAQDASWAKMLMSIDRGRHIRTEAEYRTLLGRHGEVVTEVHRDLLNIKYAMAICVLTLGALPAPVHAR